MKLNYLFAIAGLSLATTVQAQTPEWTNDTIDMQESYAKSVYYSLENGSVKSISNDEWDIAFRADLMSVGIYANHAGAQVSVFPLTDLSAKEKFGTDLTNDTIGFTLPDFALYNSVTNWDTGAFNQDKDPNEVFDLGWGVYEPTTHLIEGDKIYLVLTKSGAYQLWIESDDPFNSSNPPEWTFHIADLDGSNKKDKTHFSRPDYENRLFAYYNFENDTFFNLDPLNKEWDFIFTRYTENVSPSPVKMMYPVTGVLSNQNRPSLEIRGEEALTATWDEDMLDDMTTLVNTIGRDWKTSQKDGLYDLDTVTYFMKDGNDDIWQLEFTYATTGSASDGVEPGKIGLRKRKVQESTSIHVINSKLNRMVIAPNPTNGITYLVIDAKEQVGQAEISLTDISGRILTHTQKELKKGLQQVELNLSAYPAGLYLVNILADGVKTTSKVIVK